MDKQFLKTNKQRIAKLSLIEKKQRLLYLKHLAEGKLQGPLTDSNYYNETNLKYYQDENVIDDFPKVGMFEYLCQSNENNMNTVALEYFGNKITYNELINNVKKTICVLKEHGVQEGDVVSLALPFIPETIYLTYATEAIGAVVNLCDPRVPEAKLNNYIEKTKPSSKLLFTLDKVKPKIDKIIDYSTLNKVVFINPTSSLPLAKKYLKNALDFVSGNAIKMNNNKYIMWEKYVDIKNDETLVDKPVDSKKSAVIIYTSGTSGDPKGAQLSRYAFNALAHQLKASIKLNPGEKFLLIMPPFIAYGLAIGLHGQLCSGQTLIMEPNFNIKTSKTLLPKLVQQYKPQTIMGVPTFVRDLISDESVQQMDLSFLKRFIVGGDICPQSIENDGNAFFAQHGSAARVNKGWGLTEACSSITYTTDGSNCPETVGIANIGNKVIILKTNGNPTEQIPNIDDLEEASYDEEGEIFASAESQMNGYIDEEKNKNVFYKSMDGRTYIRTQDLGSINKDGILRISGREKDIIIRPDGHNVAPSAIETIIGANKYVEKCVVVGRPAEGYEVGLWPVAYIELKKNYQNQNLEKLIEVQLKNALEQNLPPRDIAEYYEFVEKLPLTDVGKINRLFLIKQELEVNKITKGNVLVKKKN